MQELRSIDTSTLLDMLTAKTAEYLKLNDEPGKEVEFAKCYLTLRALQAELEIRQQKKPHQSSTDPSSITPR